MKRLLKKVCIAFISGLTVPLLSIAISAGAATGDYSYYDCNDFYYKAKNTVYTDSIEGRTRGETGVYSQDSSEYIPVGWAGAQSIVYDKDTGKRVAETIMGYNYAADNGWIATTPIYYKSNGTFYTQGIVQAYHPVNKSDPYYPYHQYDTFPSPYQTT